MSAPPDKSKPSIRSRYSRGSLSASIGMMTGIPPASHTARELAQFSRSCSVLARGSSRLLPQVIPIKGRRVIANMGVWVYGCMGVTPIHPYTHTSLLQKRVPSPRAVVSGLRYQLERLQGAGRVRNENTDFAESVLLG